MSSFRDLRLVALLAFLIASAGTVFHMTTSLQVTVPLYDSSTLDLNSMTDEELCELDYETFSGFAAVRKAGVSGLFSMFGRYWLSLFVGVAVGCLLYSRFSTGPRAAAA